MKIEKVNDHQIRCTLTKADLADRELKISEIAYGTEKAKSLFRDMMQQAAIQCGFEAENIPLMIEAIPLNSDCLVLIITKVDSPEELDTRFSRFAPSAEDDEEFDDFSEDSVSGPSKEVMDLFNKIKSEANSLLSNIEKKEAKNHASENQKEDEIKSTKIFSFDSMSNLLSPAIALKDEFDDINSLYKEPSTGRYLLVLRKTSGTTEGFNKACNMLSEYGKFERVLPTSEYYFKEHFETVIEGNALQTLSKIS